MKMIKPLMGLGLVGLLASNPVYAEERVRCEIPNYSSGIEIPADIIQEIKGKHGDNARVIRSGPIGSQVCYVPTRKVLTPEIQQYLIAASEFVNSELNPHGGNLGDKVHFRHAQEGEEANVTYKIVESVQRMTRQDVLVEIGKGQLVETILSESTPEGMNSFQIERKGDKYFLRPGNTVYLLDSYIDDELKLYENLFAESLHAELADLSLPILEYTGNINDMKLANEALVHAITNAWLLDYTQVNDLDQTSVRESDERLRSDLTGDYSLYGPLFDDFFVKQDDYSLERRRELLEFFVNNPIFFHSYMKRLNAQKNN